jgi:hypothetical protein
MTVSSGACAPVNGALTIGIVVVVVVSSTLATVDSTLSELEDSVEPLQLATNKPAATNATIVCF